VKRIYIASPYTLGDPAQNVLRSVKFAEKLIRGGNMPILPLLCHLWHLQSPQHYSYWIDYSLKLLEMCDMVMRLPGESKGADNEVAHAQSLGIPVMYCDDKWSYV
jgi:hypothetical protein